MSAKEAKRELRRIRKMARRGPLAPYRLAVSVLLGLIVAGREIWENLQGDPSAGVLRFVAAGLLAWVTWGAIDSVFASASRELEAAEKRAKRAQRQAEREAQNQAHAES